MPYIDELRRKMLSDVRLTPRDGGQLNYVIHEVLNRYVSNTGISYKTINEIVGVLECVKQEFYRRIAIPYEDKKKRNNGDVALYENFELGKFQ